MFRIRSSPSCPSLERASGRRRMSCNRVENPGARAEDHGGRRQRELHGHASQRSRFGMTRQRYCVLNSTGGHCDSPPCGTRMSRGLYLASLLKVPTLTPHTGRVFKFGCLEATIPRPARSYFGSEPDARRDAFPREVRGDNSGRLAVPSRHRDASLPNNLPSELSSFVGREKELPEVMRLLEDTRLLPLTGSGGCGKTRLASCRIYPPPCWAWRSATR